MTYKTILVPLDGSAESNAALPLARTLARASQTSITLLRAIPRLTLPEDRAEARAATATLERIARELATDDVQVESVVCHGDPAEQVLANSRSRPVAFIVMRTHGRTGVGRAFLGSVTESVLKNSGVPVVVMRPGERRVTHIRKLLVPIDGSPGGAVALGVAVGLARATGASMHLLEVAVPVSTTTLAAYEFGGLIYYDPAWDEETLASARTYVEGLLERLRATDLSVDGEARIASDVAGTIASIARREDTDVIVMSTHALTGPARAILGSVADAVVRVAPCPVLLMHRPEQVETETEAEAEAQMETVLSAAP